MNALKAFLVAKRQFLLYCAIGFSGVGLDFAVYSLLVASQSAGYQAANALGYAAGTILSFTLNSRYNFRVTDRLLARFASFAAVAAVGWAASAALLHLLVEKLDADPYLAKAATLVAVVLIQYNLNRLVSFRKGA